MSLNFNAVRCVGLALCLSALSGCGHSRAKPQLEIVDAHRVLPPMLASECAAEGQGSIQQSFELRNAGSSTRVLTLRHKSCSCVAVAVNGLPIDMGQDVTVPGNTTSTVKLVAKLKSAAGNHNYMAGFSATEPNSRRLDLDIQLDIPVVADCVIEPPLFSHFFTSRDAPPVVKSLTIKRAVRGTDGCKTLPGFTGLPDGMKLVDIAYLGVDDRRDLITTHCWTARIRIDPSVYFRAAPNDRSWEMRVTDPFMRKDLAIGVPVLVGYKFGIEAPRFVYLGVARRGEVRTKKLLLSAADHVKFSVLGFEPSIPGLSVSFHESSSHDRCWVDIKWTGDAPGPVKYSLVLHTDHPQSPLVTIQVIGRVSEDGPAS